MKKFLGKPKKEAPPDVEGPISGNASTFSESDSITELQPMFDQDVGFTNDPNLNLNPSISAPSMFTEDSEAVGKSLFSSKLSGSTKQSSYFSNASRSKKARGEYGQPLQILEIPEDGREDQGGSTQEAISDKLHALWLDISFILSQYSNSVLNLSTCVVNIIDCLKDFISFVDKINPGELWSFTAYDNDDIRKILRTYLHFYDNLLKDDAYIKLRLLLCKNFNDFTASVKSTTKFMPSLPAMVRPQNYAIGVNDGMDFPNQDAISRIIEKVANSAFSLKEQNGSFIAPIARGIGKDMNVLCLYFGYPNLAEHHTRIMDSIQELYEDVHVLIVKNQIELASTATESRLPTALFNQSPVSNFPKFKLPFRNPSDAMHPPMSLSLSVETSARVSGTMGGFVYPIIDVKKQPHLTSYANSKFAISCGHVCLDKRDENVEYPYVSSPSSVLISLYKLALGAQYQKASLVEGEHAMLESRVAYGSVLSQIDEVFPMKKVKVFDTKTKQERVEMRNFPKHRFGQIIWGERTLIQAKSTKDGKELIEKRLSDLAIIRVNKLLKCDQNYLGDDVAFNEYDPSLIFDNLYVRKVINLDRHAKELSVENVNEVDSVISSSSRDSKGEFNNNGLPVFKYGSTTKFTKGNLNGIKLVYWLDGAIHSSEFVVNSSDNTTSFAAGGDSGSWIMAKLEDLKGSAEKKGLGVAGMLHSYDGEFRQFGLFTPMTEILDRLEEVTKIKWGVVGVNAKDLDIASSESGSDSDFTDNEGSEYESGVEEQAYPPDID